MFKVVIVDDEPLILRGIKKGIENSHHGFIVVGEACDGDEALEIIEKMIPDLIFTDINMPTLDGLAMIKELRKRNTTAKIVLLSGYQDFEYAKKALKFKVEEYLLKPISSLELNRLLERVYHDLDELRRRTQLELLKSMLHNDINSYPSSFETKRVFENYSSFGAILICSGASSRFNSNWITPAKDFWLRINLETILSDTLPASFQTWVLDVNNGNEKLLILGFKDDIKISFITLCTQIYDTFLLQQFPVTFIAGAPIYRIDELPYRIQNYKIVLNKNIIFGQSRLVFLHDKQSNHSHADNLMDDNTEKLLLQLAEKGQDQSFKLIFNKLLHVYESRQSPQINLENMLKRIIHMFHITDLRLDPGRLLEAELEINELITSSFRYTSIYEGMCVIIDSFFSLKKKRNTDQQEHKVIADKIEAYLRKNYSEPQSITDVADHFQLSAQAMSNIFKKYNKIPPMEFIINLRIEKAKELLKSNYSLSVKEISQFIGYEDPYYMSRIFKLVTGTSPSEFRELDNKIK